MSYPMLSAGALNAIYFGTYGLTLDLISKSNGCVLVGSGRGIIASTKSEKASSTNICTLLYREDTKVSNWERFIAGCAGGATQLAVSCPVDLVKIKLQVQTDSAKSLYKGPFDVLKKTFKAEGLTGCYRGLTVQAFRYT